MPWDEFRDLYRQQHLEFQRPKTYETDESRLDRYERIVKPKTIGDAFNAQAFKNAETRFLRGEGSRRGKPLSPATVDAYLRSIRAAESFAFDQGLIEEKARFRKLKVPKSKTMKGRPISEEEFDLLTASTIQVVGESLVEEWNFVLRGLWCSGLRLSELMVVSWDVPDSITPIWLDRKEPVLRIPASMQKNNTTEDIPLLPWFEDLILTVPESMRRGWVFNPPSLQSKFGRNSSGKRPTSEWVGKIISRIGKKSQIVVEAANPKTGAPTKFVSAHDLRRSCGQRMQDAGVPPLVISRILRHSSWETTKRHYVPGNIQQDAIVLKELLSKPKEG